MRVVAGLFFLCVVLAAGCSDKNKIPSGVIGKEEMEKIMWDMMLADQYSANYLVKDSAKINVKLETLKLYEEVFRLHHVSRDDFNKSFAFYQGRPDITRVMFDSLLSRGSRARMENYNRPPGQGATTPPAAKPSAAAGRPSPAAAAGTRRLDSIRNRALLNGRPGTVPGRPGFNTPVTPGGALPNGNPGFFPNRKGAPPAGARPFLGREARPLKAGEMPFKQVKKDSIPKGRQ